MYAPLSLSFSIQAVLSHPLLRHAIAYYTRPTNYTLARVPACLLALSISNLVVPLGPTVDESYMLFVPTNSAFAATPWGAIRGLETFS